MPSSSSDPGALTPGATHPPPPDAVTSRVAVPAPAQEGSRTIRGTVGPLQGGAEPCFADRYPCEVYDFTLPEVGPIDVALTWEGAPRALMVQLYWAGEGLAHEDVAPRAGPSRIAFTRPRMESANYRVRVVSLEPGSAIPFTLTLAY